MTPEQIARVAYRAGFRGDALDVAVAVALAESSGDPAARGGLAITDAKWGPAVGLWQIRSLNAERGTGSLRDELANTRPLVNARHAHRIWKDAGGSFSPDWVAYTSGAYKRNLATARRAASAVQNDARDGDLRGAARMGGGPIGRRPSGATKRTGTDEGGAAAPVTRTTRVARAAAAPSAGAPAGARTRRGRPGPSRRGSGGPGRTGRIAINLTDLRLLDTGLTAHARVVDRARVEVARTTARLQPLQARVADPRVVATVLRSLTALTADGFGPPGTDKTLPRIGRQLDKDIDIVADVRRKATRADGGGSTSSSRPTLIALGLRDKGKGAARTAVIEAALLGPLSPRRKKGTRPVAGPRAGTNRVLVHYGAGATGGASAGTAPKKTARQRKVDRVVKLARKQVGIRESNGDNRTKFGAWYGNNGTYWCAMFVSWVFAKAGVPLGNIQGPKGFAGVQGGNTYFRDKHRLFKKPKVGDIMLIERDPGTTFDDHTGIVVAVGKDGRYTTIEGNQGDAVRIVHHKLGDNRLYGFGRPL